MKNRLLAAAPALCCLALVLVPAGKTAAYLSGWEFTLYYDDAFLAAVTALLLVSAAGLIRNKTSLGRWGRAFSALVLPLSLLTDFFFLFRANWFSLVCMGAALVCAVLLFLRSPGQAALKSICGVGAALLIPALLLAGFAANLAAGFGAEMVTEMVPSPQGGYVAKVIVSDQGALGGNTFVEVERCSTIPLLIGELAKRPDRVYRGKWSEAVEVFWSAENTLTINGRTYPVE